MLALTFILSVLEKVLIGFLAKLLIILRIHTFVMRVILSNTLNNKEKNILMKGVYSIFFFVFLCILMFHIHGYNNVVVHISVSVQSQGHMALFEMIYCN